MLNRPPDRRNLAHLTLATVVAFVLTLIVAGHLGLRAASASAGPGMSALEQTEASIRLLSNDDQELQFVLEVPDVSVGAEGVVSIPGLESSSAAPGAPALPAYSTFVILPPGANATVDVMVNDAQRHVVDYVRPSPQPGNQTLPEDVSSVRALPAEPLYEPSPDVYAKDTNYPGFFYELSEPMYYRDLRVAQLHLYPLQYNAVSGVLEQFSSMEATIRFHGANMEDVKPASGDSDYLEALAPLAINYEQARNWRSLPAGQDASSTVLPTGRDTYKISVDEDGIFELTCQELGDAGMVLDNTDPETFEMLYRGEPVAYEFIGNGNGQCDDDEKIRFYGWDFDGSRLERQFLTENVYWLWAGGTPAHVASRPNTTAQPLAPAFRESLTREPELIFTHVWTDRWENSPNEPDAWAWQRVVKRVSDWPNLEYVHEITAPTPLQSGSSAVVTVEILSHTKRPDHDVAIYFNGNEALSGDLQWANPRSVNVTMTVPMSEVLDGPNQVHVVYRTPVTNTNSTTAITAFYFMNRITIDYDRRYVAEDEQLIFDDATGGHTYSIEGYSNDTKDEVLVWDISDRLHPVRISDVSVLGSGPYTYEFGADAGPASFIATHAGNVRKPIAISKYVGPDLDPAAGADWVAISHGDFLQEAQQLAAHREQPAFGGYRTHVVDIEDVLNQYGYGLPLPGAIRQYLRHALFNWPIAPQHLLLMGDGHINPRQLSCPPEAPDNNQCSHWGSEPETNFVLTDIVYTDVEVGLNASDYTFALLTGDDLLPDLTVGRMAVQTPAEAQTILSKIVHYEQSRKAPVPLDWQRTILFIADDPDTGGQFCDVSEGVANTLPGHYMTEMICLPSNSDEDIEQTRIEIHTAVNNPPNGATFMNYRGHGAVRGWASKLINLDDPDDQWTPWFNNEPLIILSMDCLDGYFAQPGYEALSEEFLALPDRGSVAHWSSTGFGYDYQHDRLHYGFYEGLFDHGLTAIGETINYAKLTYILESHHPSQLYSFVLQGDPAMEMIRHNTYLPALRR